MRPAHTHMQTWRLKLKNGLEYLTVAKEKAERAHFYANSKAGV